LSVNETKLDKTPVIPALTAIGLTPTQLFNRINTLTLTEGQPKEKASFNTNWTLGKFGTTFKATYYGEVTGPGTDAARDIVLTPEVLFDIEGRYKLTDKISLTLGVENATDFYPRMTPGTTVLTPSTFTTLNNSGTTAFSRYSPFGFSGRYVYGRVSLDF
jgi:iron complex outermembrane receptor protein